MSSAVEVLSNTWLFGEMMPEEKTALAQGMKLEKKQRGESLVTQGLAHTNLWILEEGQLEVQVGGQRVGELKVGDMFGEQSWLEGIPASATILCKTPASLWRVPFTQLYAFLGENPEAHIHVLRKLAINLSQRLRK